MASLLTVKITGLSKMRDAFQQSPRIFTTVFDRAVKQATLLLFGKSREKSPVDTGFLRGPGMVTSFEVLTGHVDNNAPYAKFVHEGTKYMKGRPFFEEAIEAGQSQVDFIFDRALQDFANQI